MTDSLFIAIQAMVVGQIYRAACAAVDFARSSASIFGMSLARIDREVSGFMNRWGTKALRYSLAIIFIWFGVLKPFGMSPAEPLLRATVAWIPILSPEVWVSVIGWWEVAIGVTFLFHRTVRVAIALLAVQMVGTFLPLVLLPSVVYQPGRIPYAPTTEGQYILKNLVIISAAMVIGGTVRSDPPVADGQNARAPERRES